jgi:hypothetical protein
MHTTVLTFEDNLGFSNQELLALQPGWEEDWVTTWKPFATTAGVLNDYQGEIQDFIDMDSSIWQQDVLGKLYGVLPSALRTRAATAAAAQNYHLDKWEVFGGQFTWAQQGGGQHLGVCMPYSSTLVKDTPFIYELGDKGYLRVLVGTDEDNKEIMDYAHRLVCMAFHGGPPSEAACAAAEVAARAAKAAGAVPAPPAPAPAAGAIDWSSNVVVNHKCRNPSCLNPRHLHWVTRRFNRLYKGSGAAVGHVPRYVVTP